MQEHRFGKFFIKASNVLKSRATLDNHAFRQERSTKPSNQGPTAVKGRLVCFPVMICAQLRTHPRLRLRALWDQSSLLADFICFVIKSSNKLH